MVRTNAIFGLLLTKSILFYPDLVESSYINAVFLGLLLEQIIHRRLARDGVGPFVAHESVGGNHHRGDGFPCRGFAFKGANFPAQFLVVIRRDFKLVLGKFHLTEVDDAVAAVEEQVDLHAFFLLVFGSVNPRKHIADDARNAQCLLDLADVMQANALKGQPAPSVVNGLVQDG